MTLSEYAASLGYEEHFDYEDMLQFTKGDVEVSNIGLADRGWYVMKTTPKNDGTMEVTLRISNVTMQQAFDMAESIL